MKWSAIRKGFLERLANPLRGRIDVHTTVYGRGDTFYRTWMTLDGREIVSVAGSFLRFQGPDGLPPEEDLGPALGDFIGLSIDAALTSPSPFVRGLAMLDARCGKRRLRSLEVRDEAPFVRLLHQIRCSAEGLLAPALPDEAMFSVEPARGALARAREREDGIRDREEWGDVRERLRKRRVEENVAGLLEALSSGRVAAQDLDTPVARMIAEALTASRDQGWMRRRLTGLAKTTRVLERPEQVRGVIEVLRRRDEWTSPLESWQAERRGPTRQFSSLVRHLFGGGQVPGFMNEAWLRGGPREQEWFLHIAKTGSVFGAPELPLKMSRRMAACFLEAPENYSIGAAFRFAQVMASGGDRRIAEGLRGTRLEREFADGEFWTRVIEFFIQNPLLHPTEYGPLIDYIEARRRVRPGLSMNRRDPRVLRREMRDWHRQVSRGRNLAGLAWPSSGIPGFQEGAEVKMWRLRELVTGEDLAAEGEAMQHCVASYADSCRRGKISIWALERVVEGETGKHLTIELDNVVREIRQARGKRNRLPNPDEMSVLRRWAARESLRVGEWLVR